MGELMHGEFINKENIAYYEVYNSLGYGFLENVYKNALFIELKSIGQEVEAQKQIYVLYKTAQFKRKIFISDRKKINSENS